MAGEIHIEVAYARQDQQASVALTLSAGNTVAQAIEHSGLLQRFPEIDLNQQKIGIFGQLCTLDKILADSDRVEIYRPLQQDPMSARRNRLQK